MSNLKNSSTLREIKATRDFIEKINVEPNITHVELLNIAFNIFILIIVFYTKVRVFKTTLADVLRPLTKKDLRQTEEIESILDRLLWVTKADRVCVGILHNGQKVGDLHFDKISVFYEATGPNIISIKHQLQEISLAKVYKHILNTSETCFSKFSRDEDTDKLKDFSFSKFLDSMSINTVYSRLLLGEKKLINSLFSKKEQVEKREIYGIVELHFILPPNKEEFYDSKNIRELDIVFNKLAVSLDKLIKPKGKLNQYLTNLFKK